MSLLAAGSPSEGLESVHPSKHWEKTRWRKRDSGMVHIATHARFRWLRMLGSDGLDVFLALIEHTRFGNVFPVFSLSCYIKLVVAKGNKTTLALTLI